MNALFYAVTLVTTLGWLYGSLQSTRGDPFLVRLAIVIVGAFVLRAVFNVIVRACPQLRRASCPDQAE